MKFIALISIATFTLVTITLVMGANPYAFSKKAKAQVEKKLDKISDVMGASEAKPEYPELRQCQYFRVDTKPFLCARGELILVKADKADRYCSTEGFSQNLDGKTYCQFNGVDSRLKITNATPF